MAAGRGHLVIRWWAGAAVAASLSVAPALAIAADDAAASARLAVQQQNWPQAITDWQQLYVKGNPEAPAQLCALYFDARQGKFDTSRATDWCRRAAADNDAWSLYRMGLMYLIGLGLDQNTDQAQAYCAAAGQRDEKVPAGFCLAVALKEKQEAAQARLQLPQPKPPSVADTAKLDGTPERNCERAFTTNPFDAPAARTWCEAAAAAGDPEARYRLGLMALMGIDGARDLDTAETDCRRTEASAKPHTPTAFCLAAVTQLRSASASLAMSRRTNAVDVDPTTGRTLPKTTSDPFAADQLLDQPRKTSTGLDFTCRQIMQWALYEAPGLGVLTPRDSLFGRRIVDLRPADFTALDRAAVTCAEATAPVDPQGLLSENFAAFRKSLHALETRQAQLTGDERGSRADAAMIAEVDRVYRNSHISLSTYTSQESACIDRVRQSWQASRQDTGQRELQISGSNRATENGRYVAYGTANVVDTASPQRDAVLVSIYRCTFDSGSGGIAKFQLSPAFSAAAN
jgi:hypothetical protein